MIPYFTEIAQLRIPLQECGATARHAVWPVSCRQRVSLCIQVCHGCDLGYLVSLSIRRSDVENDGCLWRKDEVIDSATCVQFGQLQGAKAR